MTAAPVPVPAPAPQPTNGPAVEPVLSAPPPLSHVVHRGDSVWKIYQSLRDKGTVESDWKDFLSLIKQQNRLSNPDKIYPGNVLSITTENK